MQRKLTFLFIVMLISAYILQAQSWMQIGEDIDGEAEGDRSGYSVNLNADGSIVAIGADLNDGASDDAGHVRVYENNSGAWTQIGSDIDGIDGGHYFGFTVSLNAGGSIVAIGAISNGISNNNGHVGIYQNNSGTWEQIGENINGEADHNYFGSSISISDNGSIVAIGAPNNNNNGWEAGHVRVYENNSGTWTQIGADINGEAAGDQLGSSVSINADGSIVAIGAPKHNDKGQVKVYENNSGIWMQIGGDIDGEDLNEGLGNSVSLSSDGLILAIGATGNWNDIGFVRVYENISGTWTQIGTDINGEAANDYSGTSISLNSAGSVVAIGAAQNDGIGEKAGHVRVYQNNSGTWIQVGTDIDGEAAGDWSGYSVSLSADGSVVAIGAHNNDGNGSNTGHVRIFDSSPSNVEALFFKHFSIFPNPTKDIVNIKSNKNNIEKLSISDITGKQILEKRLIQQKEIIDLSNFKSGIYIVSIQTDRKIFKTKIVKR